MTLIKKLNPEIRKSKKLSRAIGLDVSVLDYSVIGSHKLLKARDAIDYAEDFGYEGVLAITSGNYGNALDIVGEKSRVQPICFMRMKEPCKVKYNENRKPIVRLKLPDKWFADAFSLEKYWNKLQTSFFTRHFDENARELCNSPDFVRFLSYLRKHHLDYKNFKGVTNLCDWGHDNPYLTKEVYEVFENNDIILVPIGSGELFNAFQEAKKSNRKFKNRFLIGVTSEANPLSWNAIFNKRIADHSVADKLDVSRIGVAHKKIKRLADDNTFFVNIPDTYIYAGSGLHNQFKKESPDSSASLTSGICEGALLYHRDINGFPQCYVFEYPKETNHNLRHRNIFIKDAIPVELDLNGRVCVINTGGD